ncbi:MAG: alanine racemase [Bacteroidetes bacterium]|nr:alanine racemase [Bacteroidota bacterium]
MLDNVTRPALIIREPVCRNNIRRMAEKALKSNVIFRPHFKTHQSEQVGNWFKDYGVKQITVSSAEMAMKFAKAGWKDISIAFPANPREIPLYNELAGNIRLNLLIDSTEVCRALAGKINKTTAIFIEIDNGYGRSGIAHIFEHKIDQIIREIDKARHLSFKGFLSHSGNTYSATGTEEIKNIYQKNIAVLQSMKEKYLPSHPGISISIGDTPSCSIVEDLSGADEIRPGNFVYYDLMQYYLGSCRMQDIAVAIACPVTGIYPERNEIVVYGGAVHLSKEQLLRDGKFYGFVVQFTDDGWTEPIGGTSVISLSQEHGIIRSTADFISSVKHGELLGILPVHSCLAADLLKENMLVV